MNIKLLRKEKKLTQEQFGDTIGVNRGAFAKYESSGIYPDHVLLAISKKYKLSLEDLKRDNKPVSTNGAKPMDVYAIRHLMERIINTKLVDAVAKKGSIAAEASTAFNMQLPDSIEECHYAINVLLDKIVAADNEIDNLNEQIGLLKENLQLYKKK